MRMLGELIRNFFTHKDYLPPADQWPGTLFTPMQIIFCGMVAVGIGFACFHCAKKEEKYQKRVFFILWLLMFLSEPAIALYDIFCGKTVDLQWASTLPLWPCSIFLFTAPFAIFGKGNVRYAACGYICTLGLLGGAVNFVYPATYLSRYSCLSMAGFRTIFYHGSMVFTAVTMLLAGWHRYTGITKWQQVLLPAIPALILSIPANLVNMVVPGADYMFFKMESFFFAPIGRATPDWFSAVLIYIIYLIIHCGPYLPSYLSNRKKKS